MLTLIHFAGCSKSQCLYNYLREHNTPFILRDYMTSPLSPGELNALITNLALPARALVRTSDSAFAPFQKTVDLENHQAVIKLLARHPALMQRPVLCSQDKAVIGRPFERAVCFLAQQGYISTPGTDLSKC